MVRVLLFAATVAGTAGCLGTPVDRDRHQGSRNHGPLTKSNITNPGQSSSDDQNVFGSSYSESIEQRITFPAHLGVRVILSWNAYGTKRHCSTKYQKFHFVLIEGGIQWNAPSAPVAALSWPTPLRYG